MTVAQMRRLLRKFPGDMVFLTQGYEMGYDDPSNVMVLPVKKNPDYEANTYYLGKYDDAEPGEEGAFKAVIIMR